MSSDQLILLLRELEALCRQLADDELDRRTGDPRTLAFAAGMAILILAKGLGVPPAQVLKYSSDWRELTDYIKSFMVEGSAVADRIKRGRL